MTVQITPPEALGNEKVSVARESVADQSSHPQASGAIHVPFPGPNSADSPPSASSMPGATQIIRGRTHADGGTRWPRPASPAGWAADTTGGDDEQGFSGAVRTP